MNLKDKVSKNRWLDKDFKFCVDNYLILGIKDCARRVGRSEFAVKSRLQTHGYSVKNKGEKKNDEQEF